MMFEKARKERASGCRVQYSGGVQKSCYCTDSITSTRSVSHQTHKVLMKKRRPRKYFIIFMWGQPKKMSFLVAIQMTAKGHTDALCKRGFPTSATPTPKEAKDIYVLAPPRAPPQTQKKPKISMYLSPQGHHHKDPCDDLFLVICVIPWGRVHRAGIREWGKESDWLLCNEG